jgi:hypothetical protein
VPLLPRTALARVGIPALAVCLAASAVVSVAALVGGFGGGGPGAGTRAGIWATPSGDPSGPEPVGSVGPSGSASPSASGSAAASRSASPGPAGGGGRGAPPPPPPNCAAPATPAGWTLMWSPQAGKDGLGAFEGVEDDRAGSDPGVKHIYVQGSDYRFDMPMNERDSSPDRQRNEVKGMNAGGTDLTLGLGETWRLDWSLYIPDSLDATNRFTHIMQLKMPGDGSAPILTMDLSLQGSVPKIQLKIFDGGTVIGSTNLAPLQNTWLCTSLTFTIGDAPAGAVTWTLSEGGATLVNSTKTGVDTWLQDRVRPKWGIYRSVLDTSGSLHPCYLLLSDMRGYRRN